MATRTRSINERLNYFDQHCYGNVNNKTLNKEVLLEAFLFKFAVSKIPWPLLSRDQSQSLYAKHAQNLLTSRRIKLYMCIL